MADVSALLSRSMLTDSGCLEWQGATSRGYGAIRLPEGGSARVHRIVCEDAHGPSPEGKPHALHTCDNRLCINPAHLYWGDNDDNARDRVERGKAKGGRCYATRCIRRHEFNEENTYWSPLGRNCKECRRENVRKYRTRKRLSA